MKKKIWIIFFIILSKTFLLEGASVNELKNNIKKIDQTIDNKTSLIKEIDTQKNSIEKQINIIEVEIRAIKREQSKINSEMEVTRRKIDYSERSIRFNNSELAQQNTSSTHELIAWNRYLKSRGRENVSYETEYALKKLINAGFVRTEKVKSVQANINQVKKNIEDEKQKLTSLQKQADEKARELQSKVTEQGALVKQLKAEKQTHESDIKNLTAEKAQMESMIQKILTSKTKIDTTIDYGEAKRKVGQMMRPIDGEIVLSYGQYKNKIQSGGIEIRGSLGTQVKAAGAGKVIYAGEFQGLGKVVMIDYGANVIGVYGNLISTIARMGDRISKGKIIGVLGLSNDGQPNLYYEQRFRLKTVNPLEFF
ncbi:MAG: murein hydrolase activator EnvC family protein [Fusobacteriaceae bacterium]